MSLAGRLLGGFVLIAVVGFYFLANETLKRVERQYLEGMEEPMVDAAHLLAVDLELDVRDGKLDVRRFEAKFRTVQQRELRARIYSMIKQQVTLEAYVTDRDGVVLFDSTGHHPVGSNLGDMRDVALTLAGKYGARSTRLRKEDDDSSIMYVAAPVYFEGEVVGVVSVAKPQRAVFEFRDETRQWLMRRMGMISLAMILGAFLLSRWVARPVERLTDHARAIARGERPSLPRLGGREMKTLGHAFESMRDELEGKAYVESYVQGLTHEMKSPLAAIRGAVELLEEGVPEVRRVRFLANIREESLRLQQLVVRLLDLVALEKRKGLEDAVEVDMVELVEGCLVHLEGGFGGKQVRVLRGWEVGLRVTVLGEPFLLEMAVMNVLQNALDFSPVGGCVKLGLSAEAGAVLLSVEDEGPGLPDYARGRVFERFYSLPRPDSGRKSSGLGLCLVKEVMLLHGGEVRLVDGEGGGLLVLLRFEG
jgi:two-component system sensor histidine kinase CreC